MSLFRAVAAAAFLGAFVLNACTPKPVNEKPVSQGSPADSPLAIRTSESPAGTDSREPDLNATADGRVILSWVQKIAKKRYALRMAERDANGWSEVRTVAEGENWFIN